MDSYRLKIKAESISKVARKNAEESGRTVSPLLKGISVATTESGSGCGTKVSVTTAHPWRPELNSVLILAAV